MCCLEQRSINTTDTPQTIGFDYIESPESRSVSPSGKNILTISKKTNYEKKAETIVESPNSLKSGVSSTQVSPTCKQYSLHGHKLPLAHLAMNLSRDSTNKRSSKQQSSP